MTKEVEYIVGVGRSIATRGRGVAHAGGKITLADIPGSDPKAMLAQWVRSGRLSCAIAQPIKSPAVIVTVLPKSKPRRRKAK